MDDADSPRKAAVSNVIQGLTPVDPQLLQGFLQEMKEQVIPEILKAVEERRLQAAQSRGWQLKC